MKKFYFIYKCLFNTHLKIIFEIFTATSFFHYHLHPFLIGFFLMLFLLLSRGAMADVAFSPLSLCLKQMRKACFERHPTSLLQHSHHNVSYPQSLFRRLCLPPALICLIEQSNFIDLYLKNLNYFITQKAVRKIRTGA